MWYIRIYTGMGCTCVVIWHMRGGDVLSSGTCGVLMCYPQACVCIDVILSSIYVRICADILVLPYGGIIQ